MLSLEQNFINERKLENNQPNASSSLIFLYEEKFDKTLVTKYWDSLPLKEKEQCFTIKSQKIIDILLKNLQITQMQMQMPIFKSVVNTIANKPVFFFMEFDDFTYPFYSNALISHLLPYLSIICCDSKAELQKIPENLMDLQKGLFLDANIFEKDKDSVIKCKAKYIDQYFLVLDHFYQFFLSGKNILLLEEKYEEFFANVMSKKANSGNALEISLQILGYLFENNILRSYFTYDFYQGLRKNSSFYFMNDFAGGYKPLKTRAILQNLKVKIEISPKTPKKKPNTDIKKNFHDEIDEAILKALSHPKNLSFLEELKEKNKKKLILKNKITPPPKDFFTNSIIHFNQGMLATSPQEKQNNGPIGRTSPNLIEKLFNPNNFNFVGINQISLNNSINQSASLKKF